MIITSLYVAISDSKSLLYFFNFCLKVVRPLALFLLICFLPSLSSQHCDQSEIAHEK